MQSRETGGKPVSEADAWLLQVPARLQRELGPGVREERRRSAQLALYAVPCALQSVVCRERAGGGAAVAARAVYTVQSIDCRGRNRDSHKKQHRMCVQRC